MNDDDIEELMDQAAQNAGNYCACLYLAEIPETFMDFFTVVGSANPDEPPEYIPRGLGPPRQTLVEAQSDCLNDHFDDVLRISDFHFIQSLCAILMNKPAQALLVGLRSGSQRGLRSDATECGGRDMNNDLAIFGSYCEQDASERGPNQHYAEE